jgi:hypothetical protein
MASLKPGDRINCKIVAGVIVSAYQKYEEIRTLEIIGMDDFGYYLFVPQYLCVQNSVIVDHSRCRRIGIHPRFLGEQMCHIVEGMVYSIVQKLDGLCCERCQEFVPMAAPNQIDGSFLCWSCRDNPYR